MSRPLEGLLVVSIEQAIAAPYCTRLLADNGARVIKVERPAGGDFARGYDTRVKGLSSHFVWTNRSKESLTLDLKQPLAVAALKKLIARADIFVQNLAPGAAERLGLGHEHLQAANEKLVTCTITGYGEGGPDSRRKAYDLLIQAEAGFLSVTGTPEHPSKAGISIADIASGVSAYNTILAALLNRHRTGKGDRIEISMLEAMAEWMGFPMYFATDGALPPSRTGAGHATIFPYGVYATSDGSVLFGLQNSREWVSFCEIVLNRSSLGTDNRFASNAGRAEHREEIDQWICGVFAEHTTAEITERLERAGIGTASVNDMKALWSHPQIKARQRWQDIETPAGRIPALQPMTGNGWTARMDPVPALGEHSAAILSEIGLSKAEIAELSHGEGKN